MEQQHPPPPPPLGTSIFEMQMDATSQNHLDTISKWSKFIAITGFICMGLVVLLMAIGGEEMLDRISVLLAIEGGTEFMWLIIGLIAIGLVFVFLWLYFLIKGSNLVRKGLQASNSSDLAAGFRSLKSYFTMSIIFSILSLISSVYNMVADK